MELQRDFLSALPFYDIECFGLPASATDHSAIAVLDCDWEDFLDTLNEISPDVLIGRAPAETNDYRYARLYRAAHATALRGSDSLLLMRPTVAVSSRGRVRARYGFESAIVVERWREEPEGRIRGNIWRPHAQDFSKETVPLSRPFAPGICVPREMAIPHLHEVDFPIDVVYTWVDGTDPRWLERKRAALEVKRSGLLTEAAASDLRFVDHDELRFSLRALERNAPWIRHIWLVTDQQRPEWLREGHPRLTVVDHREIAPDGSLLPTFNSHAIEANLHRIPGLTEHFLYLNDDVFISSPVEPEDFFSGNGLSHVFLSRALIGNGPPAVGEPASDTAGKNARALLAQIADKRVSRKLFHAPFALKKSVSLEIEERWPTEVLQTRSARFRQISDLTLAGAFHMNYSYLVGKAVQHSIRYRYVNVGSRGAQRALEGLRRDLNVLQAFCLNEASSEVPSEQIDKQVRDFLGDAFPDASTFEI